MGCYLFLLFFLACSGCFPVHPCRYLPAVCCASASQPGAHSVPQCWASKAELWASISWGGTATNPAVVKSRCHPGAPTTPKPSNSSLLRRGETALPARGEHTAVLGWHEGFWQWDLPEGSSSQGKGGTSALSRHAAIHGKHRSGRCEGRGLQRCFATVSPAQYKTHSRGHCILQIIWEKIITI